MPLFFSPLETESTLALVINNIFSFDCPFSVPSGASSHSPFLHVILLSVLISPHALGEPSKVIAQGRWA